MLESRDGSRTGTEGAQIARAAEVSEATVFNYFQTKEDLVYSGLEVFEEELLVAIRDRAPGESVVDAFGTFVLEPRAVSWPLTTRRLPTS